MLPETLTNALPDDRALVAGRFGLFLALTNDRFIGRSLIFTGEYSSDEFRLLASLCPPDHAVLEIGANIGAISVPLARYLRGIGGKLYCYEPQQTIFNILCANMALNGIENVLLKDIGLGEKSGSSFYELPDYGQIGNFGDVCLNQKPSENLSSHSVKTSLSTLDTEMSGESMPIGLIKIDVQGMELDVLKGGEKTIEKHRPVIYVENDIQEKSVRLLKFLKNHNYEMYWHFPLIVTDDNYFGYKLDESEKVVSINVLAVPIEKNYTTNGLARVTDENEHPLMK